MHNSLESDKDLRIVNSKSGFPFYLPQRSEPLEYERLWQIQGRAGICLKQLFGTTKCSLRSPRVIRQRTWNSQLCDKPRVA